MVELLTLPLWQQVVVLALALLLGAFLVSVGWRLGSLLFEEHTDNESP